MATWLVNILYKYLLFLFFVLIHPSIFSSFSSSSSLISCTDISPPLSLPFTVEEDAPEMVTVVVLLLLLMTGLFAAPPPSSNDEVNDEHDSDADNDGDFFFLWLQLFGTINTK